MRTKYILGYSVFFMICALFIFIGGKMFLTRFMGVVLFYLLLFYTFSYVWRSMKGVATFHLIDYINYFITRISFLILFTGTILFGLFFYSNSISPAQMHQYTLSNGEKEVRFQEMIHIGRNVFYHNVERDIYFYKKDGGVLFFEGVKPGSEESQQKFNKALGVKFEADLYENFSKLYGLVFQNNQDLLGKVNNLDFNVDTDLDTVIKLYEKKKLANKIANKENTHHEVPVDVSEDILTKLENLNEKELKILVYINQAILNFMVKNDTTKQFLQNTFTDQDLFDVILHERNKIVSKEILDSEYDKIFVIYGELHFDGILKLLQQSDPKWEIIETKSYYPITKKRYF